ncbi:MAG: hypothetical protein AAGJ10_01565 [Bacteroidota bacterium]
MCALLASYRVLAESEHFLLTHEYQSTFLVDKETAAQTPMGAHNGDPSVGIIAPDEAWFLIGGQGVVFHDQHSEQHVFWRDTPTLFVHDAKLCNDHIVRLLVDPWSREASVWDFDTRTLTLHKVRAGPNLREQPYRDQVDF